ncbi:MAG: sulfotransferase family protein [Nodosilinea sp.]
MENDLLKSPITLIAHGRSGTSLLQNIFDAHPEVSVAGETADLIFSTWYSIHRAKGIIPGLTEAGKLITWEERTARGVRAVFDEILRLDTKYWMQKPIGQPFVIGYLQKEGMSLDKWFELYWTILKQVFPQGKFITILRHPCDVVLSSGEYWGREQASVWSGITTMARCMLHSASQITYAVNYEQLVQDSEASVKSLLEHLQVPYDPAVLKAFDYIYVPNHDSWRQNKEGFEHKINKDFSRRDEWEKLDMSVPNPEDLAAIRELWSRFGHTLELPN